MQFFTHGGNEFEGIIALPSHVRISVSCAGNATTSEKLQKIKNSYNILTIFLSTNLAGIATVEIFLGSGNVIFSENCIAIETRVAAADGSQAHVGENVFRAFHVWLGLHIR